MFFVLGVAPALLWSAPQKAQKPHTVRVKATAQRAADPTVQPALPTPPPTPEQQPAQPPQVSYLNGQLTIISRNSTLGDILRAVARQTGAVIEVPPGAGFERVAGRMGPGPARNVLAELLNGSRYDYVMIASAANPGGLQHVILTPKAAGSENSSPNPPAAAYQPPQAAPQVVPNDQDMPPDAADEQEIPPEQAPPQEPPSEQATPNPYAGAPGQPGGPPAVKTPQQLLQELQRMQQQQQQQRQNQPPQ